MDDQILWLNQKEVESLLYLKGTLKVVEEAFRQHGLKKVQMPPKLYLYFKKHNGDACVPGRAGHYGREDS